MCCVVEFRCNVPVIHMAIGHYEYMIVIYRNWMHEYITDMCILEFHYIKTTTIAVTYRIQASAMYEHETYWSLKIDLDNII